MPKIKFIQGNGEIKEVEAVPDLTILDVARQYDIDLEGSCGGCLACSTCHVIVEPEWYDRLPKPSDDEEDMLDLAFSVTETSRLGCQIVIQDDFEGFTVTIPDQTRHLTSMK